MITDIYRIPWSLVVVIAAITTFGLTGLLRADELYGESLLFEKQLIWILLSWPVMLGLTQIPYRLIRPFAFLSYSICVILLGVALFMPPINGASRWIPLGILDFQPSEPARLSFILALAAWLMHRDHHRQIMGLIPPLVMTLVPMLLVLKEPDLGTAMLFLPVLYAMLFAAGAKTKHLVFASAIGVLMLPGLWWQMSSEQKSRVVSVFTQQDGGLAPVGDGFHLHQSKQVLALGGTWGSISQAEPPIDDPSAWQLPAARTDFIFAVIGERYGVVGCGGLLLLYSLLIFRGLAIARQTHEPFGRLTAVGIVTMIGTQVVINTSMTVGLMPITGITLPLCSYGGSSLLSTSISLGLLMSISMRPGYEVATLPFESSRNSRSAA
ncbi:MAG: FtsW/RodA/SpoVE family cell cycle protein [Planctomyces sp.]|nr:FtsW/RodA/SpoVE family cell cycle protein [Planctomyces sp.]